MDIRDFLHLYLGCGIMLTEYNAKFSRWGWITNYPLQLTACKLHEFEEEDYWQVKLILRPLSDITNEERLQCANIHSDEIREEANRIKYLLSKNFDLFGLIEAGLAIDRTTLSNQ